MRIAFIGIDPGTDDDECPAVFVDEDTGEIWFQGEQVTDPAALEVTGRHSPLGEREAIVKLPARLAAIILEAVHGTYEPGRQGPGRHPRTDRQPYLW